MTLENTIKNNHQNVEIQEDFSFKLRSDPVRQNGYKWFNSIEFCQVIFFLRKWRWTRAIYIHIPRSSCWHAGKTDFDCIMLTFFSLHYQRVLVLLSATYFRKEQQCVILLCVSCNACHLSESVIKVKKLVLMAFSFVLRNKKIAEKRSSCCHAFHLNNCGETCCFHY